MDVDHENNPIKSPFGLKKVVRWSEKSLEPKSYWGNRYEDVLHERVDGFLSGVIIGSFIGGVIWLLSYLIFL